MNHTTPATRATFSVPSIIAIVAAIGSFMNGATLGLILAVVAIFFGIIGVVLSLSPAKRGGIISTFGIGAGLIGIVAAVIKAAMYLFG
ncbi:hypothetical protein OKA04_16005 [Luteolibacter flavescens]|uniref:DUF4190 domain-containing protein n=1 Tax=Luteolibacter flavescens TaxID=1859460 RepID=A0ABT3FRN7_9BACT|nr:hypothetical protein [Luteolibacter flavescens]MCW1886242.1 hypothetical protein [Luteolibacter flavescens]